MEKEKTDLYWLPVSLGEKIQQLSDPTSNQCLELINKYLSEKGICFKEDLESIDDAVVKYRGLMITARQEFEKASKEHLNASIKIWETLDAQKVEADKKVNEVLEVLTPLEKELNKIDELYQKIRTYNLEKMLETITKISSSLQGQNGDAIRFLVNNFGKD